MTVFEIVRDAFQAMKLFYHDKVCFEKLVKIAMLSLCSQQASINHHGFYVEHLLYEILV
jgi:hypothetical protein